MKDEKIIRKIIEENKEGLRRLADEEPAAERRSKLKRLKRKVSDLLTDEKKVGRVTA